jgi:hypothetical protein
MSYQKNEVKWGDVRGKHGCDWLTAKNYFTLSVHILFSQNNIHLPILNIGEKLLFKLIENPIYRVYNID